MGFDILARVSACIVSETAVFNARKSIASENKSFRASTGVASNAVLATTFTSTVFNKALINVLTFGTSAKNISSGAIAIVSTQGVNTLDLATSVSNSTLINIIPM